MLGKLDTWLTEHPKRKDLHGWRRFIVEFWFFGLKEARACLFAGLFFIAMFLIPKTGWLRPLQNSPKSPKFLLRHLGDFP